MDKTKIKIDHDKVLEIYNNLSPEEFLQLIWLHSDRINVPVFDKQKNAVICYDLDKEVPACMNGPYFQINTEVLYKDEKKIKDE